MKRILILSYYFPPLGMGGTQRMAAFARHLPAFCWQPTVLTVKPVAYYAVDPGLLKGLEKIDIVRTASLDPLRLAALLPQRPIQHAGRAGASLLQHIANFFLMPDNKILWLPFAFQAARKLLRDGQCAAILSSGPPHSAHLLARRLAIRFRLPWVADFRDGWVEGDFQPKSTALHRALDGALQRRVLRDSAHVTCVSEGLRQSLCASLPDHEHKFTVITNGYEEADFASPARKHGTRFTLAHIGTIGNFVDPGLLLQAFRVFVQDAQIGPEAVRLQFVGADLTGTLGQRIAAAGLEAYVECTGYLPHSEAVACLRRADALLYLVARGASAGFVPGKTFEYLAARKPILANCPEIEGLAILNQGGQVRHVLPENLQGMTNALKALFTEYRLGEMPAPIRMDLTRYTRYRLTQKLAEILDGLVGR